MAPTDLVLVVNLADRSSHPVNLPDGALERYLGGRGLAAYLLASYLPTHTDPLAGDNPLIFSTGPLQGTDSPFSSKVVLSAKSPLTGIYMFSLASGKMGHLLAGTGYRALVIVGQSDEPIYLWIRDGEVEFRAAAHFWGERVTPTHRHIVDEIADPDAALAMIGPAGESLVRYAAVLTELPRKRAFGRAGGGAVMGSKLLKAVAISGPRKRPLRDVSALRQARKAAGAAVNAGDHWRKRRMTYGTTTSMPNLQQYGMLPTRNWQRGRNEAFDQIAPVVCRDRWDAENHPCAAYCPAPCAQTYHVREGEYKGRSTEGPDYETIYAFGSNCAINRLDAVIALEDLADEVGLDTISTGVTLSFVMECFDRGLLTVADTGGFEIAFGDHAGALQALELIASRTGFGTLMAEGSRRLAAHIGEGAQDFAMHAKGLELGGWGCRASFGQALQYIFGSRGGCHHDLGLPAKIEWELAEATQVEGRAEVLLHTAPIRIVHDSAIDCAFSSIYYGLPVLADLLSAALERELKVETLEQIGLRILTLERLISVREGVRRESDTLPGRLLQEPLPDGLRSGHTVPLEALKDGFYRAAGWDPRTGIPTLETLEQVGLSQDLELMAALRSSIPFPDDAPGEGVLGS
jgi:aldehyde:ferredoxin oxidoreductase